MGLRIISELEGSTTMASRQLLARCVPLAFSGAAAQAQQTTGVTGSSDATTTIDGHYPPAPPQKFEGQISLNAAQSKPHNRQG
jgi:hypothetical protein